MAQNDKDIGGAWAGGMDGMEVTNKFLEQVGEFLSPNGQFYLVALKQNNVPEMRERLLREYCLQSEVRRSEFSGKGKKISRIADCAREKGRERALVHY